MAPSCFRTLRTEVKIFAYLLAACFEKGEFLEKIGPLII